MFYSIRHLTRFHYSAAVSESIMEVRMHPRNDQDQRCLNFQLSVSPRSRVFFYRDYVGNVVHHFDVPGYHSQLSIVAEAVVDIQPARQLPYSLPPSTWVELDQLVQQGDYLETLMPSHFARPSDALSELASDLRVERRDDPLTLLRELNAAVFNGFEYAKNSTRVDSPIDVALASRKGVCQDFAHIMIALVRQLGIPCRYVSGYLYHSASAPDRSTDGATHAWVEAYLPYLGWIGFDPTNNLLAGQRHIRTAVGADYAEVPPTHGTLRGSAQQKLTVSVRVEPSDMMPQFLDEVDDPEEWTTSRMPDAPADALALQQHQQQQ